jgi:NAD(P)H-nitrite reductase large subunit
LEVDRERHEVRTNRGVVRYDRLVACTGARPFLPPLKNGWLRGVTSLRTLLDAQSLLGQIRPGVMVVVVGAGVLGLETAFALRSRGCEVTVCEGASQLLGRQLDPDSAAILQAHLESKGIRFVLGDLPAELIGDDRVRALRTTSGTSIEADVVVLSAGVRPNTMVWARSGLHVERGLVVDHALRTSDSDILAAGDVVEHGGVVYGIWPAAQEMGKVAGVNAAGGSGTFSGIPMSHSLKVVDLDVFSIGTTRAQGEGMREIASAPVPPRVEKIIVHNGIVVGGILMGDTSLSVRMRAWVQERRDVTSLLDGSRPAEVLFEKLRGEG